MRNLRRWWRIPAILLIGISLKALLLTPWVAGKAEAAAVAALAAQNLDTVEFIEVDGVDGLGGDGLNVVLAGPTADEAAAVAVVEARDEIKTVSYRPTDAESIETAPADPDPEPEPVATETEPMALAVSVADDGIVLRGVVADATIRAAIVSEAESRYGSSNVTDELTVDAGIADRGGRLTVTGESTSEAERAGWLSAATALASVGGLDVVDETVLVAVEAQLNDLFALEPIEFDVTRSTIRNNSLPTLAEAATIIADNPGAGRLRVVGHTDTDGTEAANQRLSEARAERVVDYLVGSAGVDPDRLEWVGRGESGLLVDPEVSAADKQRNRRIEWELIS